MTRRTSPRRDDGTSLKRLPIQAPSTVHHRTFVVVSAIVCLLLTALDLNGGKAMILACDPIPLSVITDNGTLSITIEIADNAAERSAGLMYREALTDNHGMLFVFNQEQPLAFWMKNTALPLDLIFIDRNGRIGSIKRGYPESQTVISSDKPARFVLEVPAGAAANRGIEIGDVVRHPAIDKLRTRSERLRNAVAELLKPCWQQRRLPSQPGLHDIP